MTFLSFNIYMVNQMLCNTVLLNDAENDDVNFKYFAVLKYFLQKQSLACYTRQMPKHGKMYI